MTVKTKGKSLADLRAAHDMSVIIPNRIKVGIEAMIKAGDDWMYEGDFLALIKVNPPSLSKYREQFQGFWADLPTTNGRGTARRAWFATKKLCSDWKETVGG